MGLDAPTREFWTMINAKPSVKKFRDGEQTENMNAALNSKVFGGSIF